MVAIATNSSQFATIDVSSLKPGTMLRTPILEDGGDRDVLLLAAGTRITDKVLVLLRSRGVSRVRVHPSEVSRLTGAGEGSSPAEEAVRRAGMQEERQSNRRFGYKSDSFVNRVASHGTMIFDKQTTGEFSKNFKSSVTQVESLFDSLLVGDVADAGKVAAVSSESLVKISENLDLFVAMGLKPATDKYPCKHSLQTGMLAMSIGTILGLTPDELVELGIGCLIHDAGILHVDHNVFSANKRLSAIEFSEITKHPIISYDLMRDVADIPNGSRMVAYQMHERCNGSGYPRQRQGTQIHPLAKIASVADTFIALVSPRPHRPGMLPYRAMEQMICDTHRGLYDPEVVRGLLQTVSLFPIGSFVEVSDGRVGKVVRSNYDSYTSPVVEIWTPDAVQRRTEIVNLKVEQGLNIVKAVPELELPSCAQSDTSFEEDNWE
jgi:HD-GYP domain-containing protein (c-di-GMP phosphodiesterase class II)